MIYVTTTHVTSSTQTLQLERVTEIYANEYLTLKDHRSYLHSTQLKEVT